MVTAHGINMHAHLTKFSAICAFAAALAGCAGSSGDYPSLALRPFERGDVQAEPAPPPAPIRPATDPARISALRAEAASADRTFSARAGEADRLARSAAGQSAESGAWAAALIALAELDTQRGKTAGALAALDTLSAEAAADLSPDPALTAAQTEVAAILAREDATISRLWAVMGS